jgi:hypothetical protein
VKKRKMLKWLIGVGAILLLANIPPVSYVFNLADEGHRQYSNANGSFTFTEFKGHDIAMMQRRMETFKERNPLSSDTMIYRIFSKNPLCFWRWKDYLFDERYKRPYRNWKEIKKSRGAVLEYSTSLQDF